MFTGLVRTVGRIAASHSGVESRRLVIDSELRPADLELGASVCCSGVCLTVVGAGAGAFEVDVGFETLACTTLGSKGIGDRLNLEPSLRVGDALGGHFVSGHVDGTGRLRSIDSRGTAAEMWFDVPAELLGLIAVKGSICIDGTSLTVNALDPRGLMVGLIPHTLVATTLCDLTPGHSVNLEIDVIARYVARLLGVGHALPTVAPEATGVTMAMLESAGFGGMTPKENK